MDDCNCKIIQDLFSEYIDNELNEEQSRLVREHLSSCEVCRNELDKLYKVSFLVKNLKEDAPPSDFLDRVHKRIEQRRSLERFLKDLFSNQNIKVPVALSLMVLLIFMVFKVRELYFPGQTIKTTQVVPPQGDSRKPISSSQEKLLYMSELYKGATSYTEKTESSSYEQGLSEKMKGLVPQHEIYGKTEGDILEEKEYVLIINTHDTKSALEKIKDILKETDTKIISLPVEDSKTNRLILRIKLSPQKLALLKNKINEERKSAYTSNTMFETEHYYKENVEDGIFYTAPLDWDVQIVENASYTDNTSQ